MTEILWFVDRFGIKGDYYSIWLRLLNSQGIKPTRVKLVSLHTRISGQLLTRYATRKAPTWIPERAPAINRVVQEEILAAGPDLKAIVLASPESLAVLNLHPEYATLNRLRGSVYDVFGVPAIVLLPISVWHTQVSQRDIALTNFGLSSESAMVASAQAKGIGPLIEDFDQPDSIDASIGAGETGEASESDGEDDETLDDLDTDEDNFFYVPVMTPVGRMMLNFDTAKLSRIASGRTGIPFYPEEVVKC